MIDLHSIMDTLGDKRFVAMPDAASGAVVYRAPLTEATRLGDIYIDVHLEDDGFLYVTLMERDDPWRNMARKVSDASAVQRVAGWIEGVTSALRTAAIYGRISAWGEDSN
jgi:hypothetical protein